MKRAIIIEKLGEIEGLMYIESYAQAGEDIEDLKDELRGKNCWYDHILDESLIQGIYGDMLIDKLNLLLTEHGCKHVLESLEKIYGI